MHCHGRTVSVAAMAASARPGPRGNTTNKSIRVDNDLWREYGEAIEAAGATRAGELRGLMRWQLGWPAAREPQQLVWTPWDPPEPREGPRGDSPNRAFRIEDDLWWAYLETVGSLGRTVTGELLGFIRWQLRKPGAERPQRLRVPAGGGD